MSLFGKSVSVRKSGGGRPMPILTRAQPPRVPARADVQRQGPGRCGGFGGAPFEFYTTIAFFLAIGCGLPSCSRIFECHL